VLYFVLFCLAQLFASDVVQFGCTVLLFYSVSAVSVGSRASPDPVSAIDCNVSDAS